MTTTPAPSYAEDGCARRRPLLLWGLWLPAALEIVVIALGVLVHPAWLIGIPVIPLLAPFLIGGTLLYRNWPTGIRIDGDGLRIGAVSSTRRRPRPLSIARQNWGVFSAPWDAVATVRVVTDPEELRQLRTSARYFTLSNHWGKPRGVDTDRCLLGALTAPFMRAALVAELDPSSAELPAIRSARLYPNQLGRPFQTRIQPYAGPVWIAPTRDPARLARVIEQYPAGRPLG